MELTGYQSKNAAIFSSISCLFVCNNQSVGNQGGNGMAWVTFPLYTMVWLNFASTLQFAFPKVASRFCLRSQVFFVIYKMNDWVFAHMTTFIYWLTVV